MEEKKIYEGKLITLGDSFVGKTCLIYRFFEEAFMNNYLSTIGCDLKKKLVNLDDGRVIKLVIYDTAGQERFKSLSLNYIKKADGIFIIYDITNKQSFLNVENWIKTAKEDIKKNVPIYLIANKIDLEDERVISKENGLNLSAEYNLKFYETSCKSGANVEKCFKDMASELYDIIDEKIKKYNNKKNKDNKDDNETIQLELESEKKKKCC